MTYSIMATSSLLMLLVTHIATFSFCEGLAFPLRIDSTVLSWQSFPSSALELRNRPSFTLYLQKGWLDDESEDDDSLVTREDLHRDLLGMEPKVKRKNRKGKGGYKPLDNRDHLPFSVQKKEIDPYKTRFQKEKEQQLNKNNKKVRQKTTDLDRHMIAAASTTPSRLLQRRSKKKKNGNDKSDVTVLGEFELDKSTTSGDIICLGDKEYRVETARCQYKYAGGQRFVMVRKILEVKELTRVQNEEALFRQYTISDDLE